MQNSNTHMVYTVYGTLHQVNAGNVSTKGQRLSVNAKDECWLELDRNMKKRRSDSCCNKSRVAWHWLSGPDLYMKLQPALCLLLFITLLSFVYVIWLSGSHPFLFFLLSLCYDILSVLLLCLHYSIVSSFDFSFVLFCCACHFSHLMFSSSVLLLFRICNLCATLTFSHSFCPLNDVTINCFSNASY